MSDGQILLIIFGVYLLLIPVMAGLFKAVDAANVIGMDGTDAFVWPVALAILIAVGIWIVVSWVHNHVSDFFEKVFKKIFGVKDELQKE